MLLLDNISVEFKGESLISNISFQVNDGEKVALCGRNGAGKSTLLKIICGEIAPISGRVVVKQGKKIKMLRQFLNVTADCTVMEECLKGFEKIQNKKKVISDIEQKIETSKYDEEKISLSTALADAYSALELMGVHEMEKIASGVLKGLGFNEELLYCPVRELSGGWRMRVELAKLLVSGPDIMLLDEPTNHLDVASIVWLEKYLSEYPGTLILISHDRAFLDAVTHRTLEIVKGKLYDYPCSYSKYVELRKERMEQLKREQQNQEKYIKKSQELIEKFRYKASKAAFAQSLIRKIEKLEIVEVEDDLNLKNIYIRFPEPAHCGKLVCEIKGLEKKYDGLTVFSDVDLTISKGEKIALLGKNGQGKSTFMKILNGMEVPTNGSFRWGEKVIRGSYMQNEEACMEEDKTVWEFMDEVADGKVRKQLRNLLGAFLFRNDDIDKKIKVLSGGERVRLLLCRLLLKPYNVLLLDEPTHHLDMASKDILKQALLNYQGTYVIVSHDREFLEGLYNRIFVCENGKIRDFAGDVNDYLRTVQLNISNENTNKTQLKKTQPKSNQQKNERKKVNVFKLEKIEKEIMELEERKKILEDKMNNGQAADNDFLEYSEICNKIEEKYAEWGRMAEN
ncbi:MAG: ABC-F family ATP-binding cassette domain-containing protein [Bacteroidia bacterium]|nr:ABC-F family ATP-binding cassette domain-containing protein [Bacteroidia bacterium]